MTHQTTLRSIKSLSVSLLIAALCFATACGEPASAQVEDSRVETLTERITLLETELEAFSELQKAAPTVAPEPTAAPVLLKEPSTFALQPAKLVEFEPFPSQAPPKKLAPSQLEVIDDAVGTDVEKRTPQGVSESFTTDDSLLWAWVRVRNSSDEASEITMIWKHEGTLKSTVKLNVGVSRGWRTWSKKRIAKNDVGSWSVEVYNPAGDLLSTMNFVVTHPEMALSDDFEPGCSL